MKDFFTSCRAIDIYTWTEPRNISITQLLFTLCWVYWFSIVVTISPWFSACILRHAFSGSVLRVRSYQNFVRLGLRLCCHDCPNTVFCTNRSVGLLPVEILLFQLFPAVSKRLFKQKLKTYLYAKAYTLHVSCLWDALVKAWLRNASNDAI